MGSIEIFAYEYTKNYKKIENEADKKGDEALNGKPIDESKIASAGILFEKPNVNLSENIYKFQERIISQCIFDKDSSGVSYLITNKGRILAVDPLNGKHEYVGHARGPKFIGTAWTFWTPNVKYAITHDGIILDYFKSVSPSGGLMEIKSFPVGKVINVAEECNANL